MNEVNSYYNMQSQRYDEVFGTLYFRVYDAVTWKYLEPYVPTDGLVLDAAGGTGRWAIRMAEKGCKVTLVDNSEGMLAAAERKIKGRNSQSGITVQKSDITEMDFPDETFDLVLCEHALFLFEEPDTLIRELKRVLKKNAPLIISAQNRYVQALSSIPDKPNPNNVEEALKTLNSQKHVCMAKDNQVKVYTWSPLELRAMLEQNGLRVEKIVGRCITMPLRINEDVYSKTKFSEDLLNEILNIEFIMCEKTDALALAGHMQAIAFKL